jgi:hypothetical protein
VSDARSHAVLQDIIRRESRSLLHYVQDSFPWTTPGENAAWDHLRQLIDEENRALGDMVRYLIRQHATPPYLGSYPSDFTTLNYVSLEYLLPRLTADERQAVARLEADLAGMADPEARNHVQKHLEIKRRQLKMLEGMLAAPRVVAAAS